MTLRETSTQKYVLEHDGKSEVTRLQTQHEVLKLHLGGELLMPGIKDDLLHRDQISILESGTAGGTWLRDVGTTFPNATLVGTDLTTSFFPKSDSPETSSPNITFASQDILKPWPEDFHHRFDLVHQRLVLIALRDPTILEDTLRGLAETVKPGGWIQLQESDFSSCPPSNGPAVTLFQNMLNQTSPVTPKGFARHMGNTLQDLGFENVQEKVVDISQGYLEGNPELGEKNLKQSLAALKGFAVMFKGKGLCPDDELETLPDRFIEECETRGGYIRGRIFWGRKRAE